MSKIIRKFGVAAALLFGMTVCVASQAGAQTTRYSVFGGYSYGTSGAFLPEEAPFTLDTALNGYGAAFAVNLSNHIGLEANFTGHNGTSTILSEPATYYTGTQYGEDQGVYTYAFGPRLFQNVGNFSLFTHFLVGGMHVGNTLRDTCTPGTGETCGTPNPEIIKISGSGFAFKTGGGADWNHGRWGIRILEVDYVHGQMLNAFSGDGTPVSSLTMSTNNFELTTGITFNFGRSL